MTGQDAKMERQTTAYRRWLSVPALAMALLAGCGESQPTLTGVVTLDGAPLATGNISFLPTGEGAGASASIGLDGAYDVRTGSVRGLAPGDYVVTVSANGPPITKPGSDLPLPGKLLTPKKYSTSQTSDLRATVQPGDNTLNFELTSNAK
jgi:hypothetical protein